MREKYVTDSEGGRKEDVRGLRGRKGEDTNIHSLLSRA